MHSFSNLPSTYWKKSRTSSKPTFQMLSQYLLNTTWLPLGVSPRCSTRLASRSTGFCNPNAEEWGQLAFAQRHDQQEPKAVGVHFEISHESLRGHYLWVV